MRKYLIIFIIVVSSIISGINGCVHPSGPIIQTNSYQDVMPLIKYNDDYFTLFRYCWQDIIYRIEESEFCVLADVTSSKTYEMNMYPTGIILELPGGREIFPGQQFFTTEGKLKIKSIIYGNPQVEEIPFSFSYNEFDIDFAGYRPWAFRRSVNDVGLAHFLYSEPTSIVLGKGKGKDIKILQAVGESLQVISPQTIKVWKDFIRQPVFLMSHRELIKDVKRQGDWLRNSNNPDLLLLCFIMRLHCLNRCRIPEAPYITEEHKGIGLREAIEMIQTLADDGIDTPERRFLAYSLATFGLYEFTGENEVYDVAHPLVKTLTDNQRQVLIDIASRKFSQITSPKEGIKYLRLISRFSYDISSPNFLGGPFSPFEEIRGKESKLFSRAPGLKDKLQPIALGLSARFKNDPDYSEWAEWVNRIFPAENK